MSVRFFLGSILLAAQISFGVSLTADDWLTSLFLKQDAAYPFSFTYGRKAFHNDRMAWQSKVKSLPAGPGVRRWQLTLTNRERSLQVQADIQQYLDSGALEWVLSFTNQNPTQPSPLLLIQSVDLTLHSKQPGRFLLHHAIGAQEVGSLFHSDFQPLQTRLEEAKIVKFIPTSGESSSTAFPFFNLEMPGGQGTIAAIGWTGTWNAHWVKTAPAAVHFALRQDAFSAQLLPLEMIRTPRILLMRWESDRLRAQNTFRKLIATHFYPKSSGKPIPSLLGASTALLTSDLTLLAESNAQSMLRQLALFPDLYNVFWIDAGWYPTLKNNWVHGVGDWVADRNRFPKTLLPISGETAAQGMKFLLWYEPERVAGGTQLAGEWRTHHPDWLLSTPNGKGLNDPGVFTAVHLGNPQARQALQKILLSSFEEQGVKIYRQDMNLHNLPALWQRADELEEKKFRRSGLWIQRTGIAEAKYIAGLYTFWDELRASRPDLIIDNCASGGRRIDIETMQRTVTLWRSDKVDAPSAAWIGWDPQEQQNQMLGLSLWFPLQGRGTDYHSAADVFQYKFRSGYGYHQVHAMPFSEHETHPVWKQLRNEIAIWKELREDFGSDFYPWMEEEGWKDPAYLGRSDIWVGWQLNQVTAKRGFVQAFRRFQSTEPKARFILKGLNPALRYEIYSVDAPQDVLTQSGRELMTEGLAISLEKQSAAILRYRAIEQ